MFGSKEIKQVYERVNHRNHHIFEDQNWSKYIWIYFITCKDLSKSPNSVVTFRLGVIQI